MSVSTLAMLSAGLYAAGALAPVNPNTQGSKANLWQRKTGDVINAGRVGAPAPQTEPKGDNPFGITPPAFVDPVDAAKSFEDPFGTAPVDEQPAEARAPVAVAVEEVKPEVKAETGALAEAPKASALETSLRELADLRLQYDAISNPENDPVAILASKITEKEGQVKAALIEEANKGVLTPLDSFTVDPAELATVQALHAKYTDAVAAAEANDAAITNFTKKLEESKTLYNAFLRANAEAAGGLFDAAPSKAALEVELRKLTRQSGVLTSKMTTLKEEITDNDVIIAENKIQLTQAMSSFAKQKVGLDKTDFDSLDAKSKQFVADKKAERLKLEEDNAAKAKTVSSYQTQKDELEVTIEAKKKEIYGLSQPVAPQKPLSINELRDQQKKFKTDINFLEEKLQGARDRKDALDKEPDLAKKAFVDAYTVLADKTVKVTLASARGVSVGGAACPASTADCTQVCTSMLLDKGNNDLGGKAVLGTPVLPTESAPTTATGGNPAEVAADTAIKSAAVDQVAREVVPVAPVASDVAAPTVSVEVDNAAATPAEEKMGAEGLFGLDAGFEKVTPGTVPEAVIETANAAEVVAAAATKPAEAVAAPEVRVAAAELVVSPEPVDVMPASELKLVDEAPAVVEPAATVVAPAVETTPGVTAAAVETAATLAAKAAAAQREMNDKLQIARDTERAEAAKVEAAKNSAKRADKAVSDARTANDRVILRAKGKAKDSLEAKKAAETKAELTRTADVLKAAKEEIQVAEQNKRKEIKRTADDAKIAKLAAEAAQSKASKAKVAEAKAPWRP